MSLENNDLHIHECIRHCLECQDICSDTLFNHVLERDGEIDPNLVKILIDCMQICQTCSDFMRRNSSMHFIVCTVCAQACEVCADCFASLANKYSVMDNCAKICRKCAVSCRSIAAYN